MTQVARERTRIRLHNRDVLSLGNFKLTDPETSGKRDRGLRTFICSAVHFVGWAPHGKGRWRNVDHVRWRGLPGGAVEFLRSEIRGAVGENHIAESIGDRCERGPVHKIRRDHDAVSGGWSGDGELESADRLPHTDQLNAEGI